MKKLVAFAVALVVVGLGVTVAMAANTPGPTPGVHRSATQEGYAREYVVPQPGGAPYCFSPEPALPADLPACPASYPPTVKVDLNMAPIVCTAQLPVAIILPDGRVACTAR